MLEYAGCLMNGLPGRTASGKNFKKREKTSWQIEALLLIYKSSLRRAAVPCKLNNAKTKWTPWTINGLFKISRNRINSQRKFLSNKCYEQIIQNFDLKRESTLDTTFWEFDPGSGRTLAACLTHASRTEWDPSGFYLVANGWVTREKPASQWGTTVGNDC